MTAALPALAPPAYTPLAALRYAEPFADLAHVAREALQPDPPITVSQWAEKHRILTSEASAEPGPWSNARFPYLVEPMDCGSPTHPCKTLVMRFASQLGKSEVQLNILFTFIDTAPCPILWVMPDEKVMQRTVKTRLHPGIRATPRLLAKIPVDGKVAGQSVLSKEFPGGHLAMGSLRSPSTISAMPVRLFLVDEADRAPASSGKEGDPITMGDKRTDNFHNCKKVYISSPSIESHSHIDRLMDSTDDRRYLVPCPHCGKHQELVFSAQYANGGIKPHGRLVWENNDPKTAKYQCGHCEKLIDEKHKTWMLTNGRWQASRTDGEPDSCGFHLNGLYCPTGFNQDWPAIVRKFLTAKNSQRPENMQVFVNTVLGVSFADRGQAPDHERLHERCEPYRMGFVPGPRFEGAQRPLVLTAACDVQKDRLEYSVYGWAPNGENWLIEYDILYGDPYDLHVFTELEKRVLQRNFPFDSGRGPGLWVSKLAIDSGYATHPTYHWVRRQDPKRVIAIKGAQRLGAMVAKPSLVDVTWQGITAEKSLKLWRIDDAALKSELYTFLKRPLPSEQNPDVPGAAHFPIGLELAFFQGLTAEVLTVKRDSKGYQQRVWEKIRDRNEPLDLAKYNRAAFLQHGFDRWTEQRWQRWRGELFGDDLAAQQPKPQRRLQITKPYSG